MEEESIYNIIPKNPQITPKKSLYKSKYPYYIPPTGSTFCHHTTLNPGISNLSGQFHKVLEVHHSYASTQSFGYAKGVRKSSPVDFQRKRTGIMGSHDLPPIRNFSYDCPRKKQKVPLANQRPVYGKKSNKNFIIANAIQNILSSTKSNPEQIDWLKKKDYGKAPQYLNTIKQTLQNEYNLMRTLQQQREQKQIILSPQEINQIKEGLKEKWNEINKKYQQMTHIKKFDIESKMKKKQSYEKQLMQIEEYMKKLGKEYIFIEG